MTHKNVTQLLLSYETFVYAMDFILKFCNLEYNRKLSFFHEIMIFICFRNQVNYSITLVVHKIR